MQNKYHAFYVSSISDSPQTDDTMWHQQDEYRIQKLTLQWTEMVQVKPYDHSYETEQGNMLHTQDDKAIYHQPYVKSKDPKINARGLSWSFQISF